jgi:hypothetical protein
MPELTYVSLSNRDKSGAHRINLKEFLTEGKKAKKGVLFGFLP